MVSCAPRYEYTVAFVLHSGGFEHKPILLAAPEPRAEHYACVYPCFSFYDDPYIQLHLRGQDKVLAHAAY